MNESISFILATTILALSGVGLYMYKSSGSFEKDDDDYDEDKLFNNSSSFFNWNKNDNNDDDIEEDYEYKSYKKGGIKTQKNRKTNGTSKRRY